MNSLRILLFMFFSFLALVTPAQQWKPVGTRIRTIWSDKVDPVNPLPEYPRPQLVRDQWQNLNGLWDFAVLPKGHGTPEKYEGSILVPFAIESSLSGVQGKVGPENELWYRRSFTVPAPWKGKHIMLNFGAVDWKADVWLNNVKIGSHSGGYTPFSIDLTPWLNKTGNQQLVVRVWDPSDEGYQPHGKQVKKPQSIWYTSVTGIWQTVWIEPVNTAYISGLKTVPDIDGGTLTVKPEIQGMMPGDLVEVKILDQGKLVSTAKAAVGQEVLVTVPGAKLWSPETPFLYDLQVSLIRNGVAADLVKSYFGMRKISVKRDDKGVVRLQLNNKNYFQYGPLDQGWWPDGLYTAPTDEALAFDIQKTKDFGFNLIRKHVKVEPARWYYHCDRLGMLVWQDMPSGDDSPEWQTRNYFNGKEMQRSAVSEENYRREWKEIIDLCYSNPCVVTWVPFNEAWGQFKTPEIVEWTKIYDPSRLVNPASGGNHYDTGDMLDIHNYPDPVMAMFDGKRACVLGEYGGIGLALEGHLWETGRNWGYVQYKTSEEATDAYVKLAEKLKALVPTCYSAAIYTQTTDVEIEVNGLMTYDRKVIKLNEERVRKVNLEVRETLSQPSLR
ncbi:MAG TPA: glycoside hydrolase family 2 TIM barrel-domain containing protein [Bacteroidales bacterium]|nr:glycoside hydrolase family 2 TIM barrel-domain containing protein [Bacteroidales bacterium]